jgi:type II secretory pathway pseudopilin PulG
MVIIGIIAVFSIPNFTKTINRARSRDAVLNLNVIHSSNVLYRVRSGVNLTAANVAAINATLGLNIVANGATYVCNAVTCVATGTGFVVTATLATALSGANPACVGASCP